MASVLVVDDDADGREALSIFLRNAGHTVDCAADGREAIILALAHIPDVLILDMAMPGMDGRGVLEVLRSYARLQSLPVILWTGAPDSARLEQIEHLKIAAILSKPRAKFGDILREVERLRSATAGSPDPIFSDHPEHSSSSGEQNLHQ